MCKGPRIVKMLPKDNEVEVVLLKIKIYDKAIINKIMWYQYKERQIDQWNRTESTKTEPQTHRHLIPDNSREKTVC